MKIPTQYRAHFLLAVCLAALSLGGCGDTAYRAMPAIRRGPELRIAAVEAGDLLYPDGDSFKGPFTAFAAGFAEALGVQPHWTAMTAEQARLALATGDADLALGDITLDTWPGFSPELTAPLHTERLLALSAPGDMVSSIRALRGKRVGLAGGSGIEAVLKKADGLSFLPVSNPEAAAVSLTEGGLDVLICREDMALSLLPTREGQLRCDDLVGLPAVEYRAAAAPGNRALLEALNRHIEEAADSPVSAREKEATGNV